MPKTDPRVDMYVDAAADFAKPILIHLRAVVHRACPDVEETLKWSMPTFVHHGILCGMAAFKQHVSFGFWKHALVMGEGVPRDGMGSFGKVTKMSDLPNNAELTAYIRKAVRLNEDGVKVPRSPRKRPALPVPPDLATALGKAKKPPLHSRNSVRVADASTSSGLPKPSARRRAVVDSRRRSNGWNRAKCAIGNI